MPVEIDQLATQHARHLVDPVGHQEPAVEDRHGRLGLGQIVSVHVNSAHGRHPHRAASGGCTPAASISQGVVPVFGQKQRAVKVRHACPLRHQHGGRHGKARSHHAADHHVIAPGAGRLAQGQRLGQPAGLVELDVDHVVLALERGQAGAVMAGLVGADRHRAVHPEKRIIRACGQRLFHQRDPEPHQMRGEIGIDRRAPPLVGIDDDLCPGRAAPHRLEPGHIVRRAELDLEQRAGAHGAPPAPPSRRALSSDSV